MNLFQAAAEELSKGSPAALVTVISVDGSSPRHAGAKMLVRADRTIIGTIGGGALEQQAIEYAIEALTEEAPKSVEIHTTRDLGMCCGGAVTIFIEPLNPPTPAIIFGAGHISHALVPVLLSLGFSVSVVDERLSLNNDSRFKGATLIHDSPVEWANKKTNLDDTFVLVVTHDHALDQQLIQALLPKKHVWLGVIGSQAKISKFLLRLRAAGTPDDQLKRLIGPVGLDIGAETPAEIAISVSAEWIRLKRGATDRPPNPLSSIPISIRGSDGIAVPMADEKN